MTISQNSIRLFLSYAKEDEQHLRKLEKHLVMLERQGLISTWNAQQIVPGANRAMVTDEQFELASIILLLVSADFLASDYCYQIEMKRALEQQETNQAQVIPIIVSPCDWSHAPFAKLQCLPYGGRGAVKAITTWSNRDEAWTNVIEGIRKTIEDLHQENVPAQSYQEAGSESKPAPSTNRSSGAYEQLSRINGFLSTSDAGNAGTLLYTLDCHTDEVYSLAWSPDGKAIASASDDKTVHVWNPATLRSPTHTFQSTVLGNHTDRVKAVVWSPDSAYLASAGSDATVQVWNMSTRESAYTYRGHAKRVRALAWSPNGDVIASAGDDRTIHLWKAPRKRDREKGKKC